jgi:xylulokinase
MGLPPYLDYSLASRFLMFDVRRHRWSEPILGAAGLSPECLPIPVAAGTVAGPLSSQAAAQLGLRPGTPVVVGGHDQASGALGMGAIEPGMVSDSMGTYECLVHVDGAPRLDDAALAANLNSYCHVVPDRYITIAYFPSGIMLQWYRDTFGSGPVDTRAGADLFARAEELAPSSPTGLCVLPHLIGSATPHFDVRATGVILGLTPNADGPTIFKGILEGIASELAIVSDLLAGVVGPFDTIRASGGGARSSLGMRLRAALTGRRIHLLESPESVCLGAALLAGAAVGVYSDLTQAVANTVRVVDTIEPDAELAAAYAGQLRQYRLLYPALAPVREAKSGESDD